MATNKLNRWTPLQLNKNMTLSNRVVVPPMASQTAGSEGLVTSKTLEHYQKLSEAKAGLLMVEYTYVHVSGRSEENQLGISGDEHIDGLSQIAKLIHESGSIAGIQFSHGGAKTERVLTGGSLMGPSAISVPVKGQVMEVPNPMTSEDIELWKTSFVDASDRAVKAGFDLIELHSAHGYGLNQWLSPVTNQREDEYGRDLHGRMKLLLEIVHAIRRRHSELLISVRMPGQDFIGGGISIKDSVIIAECLENAGVNIINVSSGIGGWRRPAIRVGEGYLVSDAAQIQANVKIPVIGVGGIESGAFIDQSLQCGHFSLAAVGRAILKNPRDWKEKNLEYEV